MNILFLVFLIVLALITLAALFASDQPVGSWCRSALNILLVAFGVAALAMFVFGVRGITLAF